MRLEVVLRFAGDDGDVRLWLRVLTERQRGVQTCVPAFAEGRALTESETNLARARYVRKALEQEAGSVG